jgi:hypothetical protein
MNPTSTLRGALIALLLIFTVVPRPPLDVHDIFGMEYADDPQLSPDGERIVYVAGGWTR